MFRDWPDPTHEHYLHSTSNKPSICIHAYNSTFCISAAVSCIASSLSFNFPSSHWSRILRTHSSTGSSQWRKWPLSKSVSTSTRTDTRSKLDTFAYSPADTVSRLTPLMNSANPSIYLSAGQPHNHTTVCPLEAQNFKDTQKWHHLSALFCSFYWLWHPFPINKVYWPCLS